MKQFNQTTFYDSEMSDEDNWCVQRKLEEDMNDLFDHSNHIYMNGPIKLRNPPDKDWAIDRFNYWFEINEVPLRIEGDVLEYAGPNKTFVSFYVPRLTFLALQDVLRFIVGNDLLITNDGRDIDGYQLGTDYKNIGPLSKDDIAMVERALDVKFKSRYMSGHGEKYNFELNVDSDYSITLYKCLEHWYITRDGYYNIELDGFDSYSSTDVDDLPSLLTQYRTYIVTKITQELEYHKRQVDGHAKVISHYMPQE